MPTAGLVRRWLIPFLIAFMAAVASAPAWALDFDLEKLGKIKGRMEAFVSDQQIAGAVTLVGTAAGIAHFEATGLADRESNRPMEKNTVFRIASMTKPLTAMGIMLLVDEKKLSVDDPIEKHLPEFKGQMLLGENKGDVLTLKKPARAATIRDLLTHTAGLAAFPPGLSNIYGTRNRTLGEMVAVTSQQPLQFEPGSKWSYCNPGIDTLGRIIEVTSGQPFERFMHDRLFHPLGMHETAFFPSPEIVARTAASYARVEGKLSPVVLPLIGDPLTAKHPIAAGGLYSTAADLAKVYQFMLNRGKVGDRQLLSEAAVATMTTLQTGDLKCGFVNGMGFGYGWAVVRQPEGATAMLSPGTYGHGGAFGTQGWIDPQRGVFYVLLFHRVGLSNGDASDMRIAFQELAASAVK